MLVFTKMEIMMKSKTCISCKRPFEEHTKEGSIECIEIYVKNSQTHLS